MGRSGEAGVGPRDAARKLAAGEVRLWQDAGIFTLVGRLLGSAERRLLVEMYELGRAEIVASLGAAKARGVAVRVITDPSVTASRESAGQLDALGSPNAPTRWTTLATRSTTSSSCSRTARRPLAA